MDLAVVGSNPTRHPIPIRYCVLRSLVKYNAFVAQLDRATDFESVGCTFDSCRTQFIYGPLAQLVEQQTLNLWVASSILAWLKKGWKTFIRESGEIGIHARLRI